MRFSKWIATAFPFDTKSTNDAQSPFDVWKGWVRLGLRSVKASSGKLRLAVIAAWYFTHVRVVSAGPENPYHEKPDARNAWKCVAQSSNAYCKKVLFLGTRITALFNRWAPVGSLLEMVTPFCTCISFLSSTRKSMSRYIPPYTLKTYSLAKSFKTHITPPPTDHMSLPLAPEWYHLPKGDSPSMSMRRVFIVTFLKGPTGKDLLPSHVTSSGTKFHRINCRGDGGGEDDRRGGPPGAGFKRKPPSTDASPS
mmetsp:Transcript_43937/g.133060  ORF Transcript_43937/g.133060 Transcript_43937/m.133060 type:complete len:252 (-) Transcript_43937:412-1167(-)